MKIEVRDLNDFGQELYINHRLKECTGKEYASINCVEIVKYMRLAYEAGKNKEPFDYIIIDED